MALRFKRGLLAGIPALAEGQPALTVDNGTERVYIGTANGNVRLARYDEITQDEKYHAVAYVVAQDPSVDTVANTLFGTTPTLVRSTTGIYHLSTPFSGSVVYLVNGCHASVNTRLTRYVDSDGATMYYVTMSIGGDSPNYYLVISVYNDSLTLVDPAQELILPIYIVEA